MKKCSGCDTIFDNEINFCPECGSSLEEWGKDICPSCGVETEIEQNFCHQCGYLLNEVIREEDANDEENKDLNNFSPFLAATNKSNQFFRRYGMEVNTKKTDKPKSYKASVIVLIAIVCVITLCIGLNIHKCEECYKTYVGKSYSLMGNEICKKCYKYYTVLEW